MCYLVLEIVVNPLKVNVECHNTIEILSRTSRLDVFVNWLVTVGGLLRVFLGEC